MSYDQARWSEDDQYEPLLSEKCNREVNVDALVETLAEVVR